MSARLAKLQAKAEQQLKLLGFVPTQAEWLHAQRTTRLLDTWKAPRQSILAALIAPFIDRNHVGKSFLNEFWDTSSIDSARNLVELRRSFGTKCSEDRLALALGKLYRQAYLEAPEWEFILLLLADHDATISSMEKVEYHIALQTRKVFAPLAEMLGMWQLYRSWTEKSFATLFPEQYSEMTTLLGSAHLYSEKAFRKIRKAEQIENSDSALSDRDEIISPYLRDKADAFLMFKRTLRAQLKEMGVAATIMPITHHAGLALGRVHQGESVEDVARRLSVRIFCRNKNDCYTILGLVHRLGKPVSIGSTLHFKDHIASPQPNGYQSLHAAINLQNFKGKGRGSLLVECRILTEQMHKLNRAGITLAKLQPDDKSPRIAWWHRIADLERYLPKPHSVDRIATVKEFLKKHETRSDSDPIYVFTPRGEVMILPYDSTPLDFAYSIHSQMGHHALRMEVNANSVPYGYPLRNGDIVRVHYDANFSGPDLSWLGLVKTTTARSRIQQGLKRRASAAHPGRALFEQALVKTLNWFQREKNYKLNISTERVEDFFNDRARFQALDVRELYARVNGNIDQTNKLVQQLISMELAPMVLTYNDNPISRAYEPHKITICMKCRPAPSEAIIGLEAISPTRNRKIVVHSATKKNCTAIAHEDKRVSLKWAEPANVEKTDLLVFRLKGADRPGLLKEVLNVIYQTRKTQLLKVDATTSGDGQADIALLVEGQWFGGFDRVPERLGKIAGIHDLSQSPPSPSQLMALYEASTEFSQPLLRNPYTSEEVFHKDIFFNRKQHLERLRQWLREGPDFQTIIVHGQRRVGKTSLIKYLTKEYLEPQRLIKSVFVDLQALDEYTSAAIASLIVRKIFDGQPVPERGVDEVPWVWADRAITKACELHQRLLIIVDEFNFLIEAEKNGKLDDTVYINLRYLIKERRDVNWIIIVQDTHFYDLESMRGAGPILQHSDREVNVQHLELDWAKQLILEPTKICGIRARNEAHFVNQVFRLTAGNPFLIHLICSEIVQSSKGELINKADVDAAADWVLHMGARNFAHFTKNLVGIREVVMAAICNLLQNRKSVSEDTLFELLRQEAPEISSAPIGKSVEALLVEGQITFKEWRLTKRISIPIELYRRFIVRELDLVEAIDKWRKRRQADRSAIIKS